jgi:glutathione peroxidase
VNSIHKFKFEGIRGEEMEFSQYAGKKLMIVNVASACGFTPQYQQLQELYEEFQDKLTVVGFPSNDFGGQEPGTNEDILNFCQSHYGVSFPMAAKISIRPQPHAIYAWLSSSTQNGVLDSEVKWNFHKFLLNENGQLEHSFPSAVSPFDERILNWLSAS